MSALILVAILVVGWAIDERLRSNHNKLIYTLWRLQNNHKVSPPSDASDSEDR